MHCLVQGIRFQFFGPRVFMVFRIRQLSQVCESVLESYRLKYCERVRYSESSLHLPNEPNEFYLFALLCCVVEQKCTISNCIPAFSTAKYCKALTNPENGQLVPGSCLRSPITPYKDCSVQCDPRFVPEDPAAQAVACVVNGYSGIWNGTLTKCIGG